MAKRKKVGSIDYTPFILVGVLGVGGYFLWKSGFFSSGNALNNQAIANNNSASIASDLAAAKQAGEVQQQSNSALQAIAASIYTGLSQDIANNITNLQASETAQDAAVYQFSLIGSLVDLLLVIQYFGTKNIGTSFFSICQSLGLGCTAVGLQQYLDLTLDSDHIAQINQDLSGNGINYQFT